MSRASGDERRAQILAAAGRLVRRKGFSATRMADVADELHLSAPLIVYHFGTKDHLMAATLAAEAQAELERLDAVVRGDLDPLAKVMAVVGMSLGRDAVADWRLWIDAWGEGLRSPVMAQHLHELDRRWRRALERVISEGVETGAFSTADVRASAERATAIMDGFGVQLVRAGSTRSQQRVLAAGRAAILAELGAGDPP